MTEGLIGILIFAASVIGCAIWAHRKISRPWVATVLAAFGAALLIQVIGYTYLGYLDPFFMIAFVVSLFWGIIGALVIGYIMRRNGKAAVSQDAT